ncbi:heterokaryon incompatibility [Lasiosphaeria hispida]|uniref:Heterokaryon incompatibility n=1 Tax=Lasiosphaeria hispida TaxID=260671 RepID=A0AAJ0H5T9_9PEZI|nr:heterokaryon incompatibility [Lasiosphaeria hispida]
MHRFQRFAALSYVWGDAADPARIVFNGVHGFPVTRNLHAALRSLRRVGQGLRLWVDALCINQADLEEKKTQLGLMKRVYQQARKVISYTPMSIED